MVYSTLHQHCESKVNETSGLLRTEQWTNTEIS